MRKLAVLVAFVVVLAAGAVWAGEGFFDQEGMSRGLPDKAMEKTYWRAYTPVTGIGDSGTLWAAVCGDGNVYYGSAVNDLEALIVFQAAHVRGGLVTVETDGVSWYGVGTNY